MSRRKNEKDLKVAAAFAAGGSAAGAGLASVIGNVGLAGAFGGVAIGAMPIVCAGTVAGMAAYGIKKLFD